MSNETEVWMPVLSKPGVLASSLGRVKMPAHMGPMPRGNGVRLYEPKPTYGYIGRASKRAQHQYMGVKSAKFGSMKVHRLVCEAFHGPAPEPDMVVIHLDESGTNNRPENLKWGTQKENLNMPKFIAYCRSRLGEQSPATKGRRAKEESCRSPT